MATDREIEQVQERVSLVELISGYTGLKKSGANFAGLCPFHGDKDPSFSVNEEKKLWHCFGCKRGGNMFTFIMEMENVGFGEALEMLARQSGVTLSDNRKIDPKRRELKDRIKEINILTAKFFFKVLTQSQHGEKFMSYLLDRGVTKDQIRSFKLGASFESWDSLINALSKKGFSPKDITAAGLAIHKEDRNSYYDRFRNRLMFPLFNVVGDVIGFAGRAYGDDMPKYLNTPETPLFDKGKMLYGLDRAKKPAADNGIIITEGYMDVIALHGAGLNNAVASMGTALTNSQVSLIRRYTDTVVLSYDSDFAGDSASMRGIEMLVEAEMKVRVIALPEGEDPDSLVKKGGRESFQEYINNASDYFDFFLTQCRRRVGDESPSGKAEIIRQMSPLINKSPNEILQSDQKRRLAEALGITERQVYSTMEQVKDKKTYMRKREGGRPDTPAENILGGGARVEKAIMEALFSSTGNALKIMTTLEPEDFTEQNFGGLFSYARKWKEANDGQFDPDDFLNAVHPQEVVRTISSLTLAKAADDDKQSKKIDGMLAKFRSDLLEREHSRLKRELEAVAKSGDLERQKQLLQRIRQISREKFGN